VLFYLLIVGFYKSLFFFAMTGNLFVLAGT